MGGVGGPPSVAPTGAGPPAFPMGRVQDSLFPLFPPWARISAPAVGRVKAEVTPWSGEISMDTPWGPDALRGWHQGLRGCRAFRGRFVSHVIQGTEET